MNVMVKVKHVMMRQSRQNKKLKLEIKTSFCHWTAKIQAQTMQSPHLSPLHS